MKIIISKTFSKKYLGKLSKYFSEEDFVQKLRNTHTITLKYPHFKVKIRMNMVEFRGVVLIQQGKYIIPLLLSLKKDKKNGENIIWENFEKEILSAQEQTLIDIENKQYRAY